MAFLFVCLEIWTFHSFDRLSSSTLPSRCSVFSPLRPSMDFDRRWCCWHLSCNRSTRRGTNRVQRMFEPTDRGPTSSSWWIRLRWRQCHWSRRHCSWVTDRQAANPILLRFHSPSWIERRFPASSRALCKSYAKIPSERFKSDLFVSTHPHPSFVRGATFKTIRTSFGVASSWLNTIDEFNGTTCHVSGSEDFLDERKGIYCKAFTIELVSERRMCFAVNPSADDTGGVTITSLMTRNHTHQSQTKIHWSNLLFNGNDSDACN